VNGFSGVKNCAEVDDFAGCAAGKPRKLVLRPERVTGGPNSEGERRRDREAAQFSPQASGQGEAALSLSLSCVR
jgi:hypothetical protein